MGREHQSEISDQESQTPLSWVRGGCRGPQGALSKIDLLLTTPANMFSIKLIGKDLNLFAAVGAFAGK